ncbi:MAG: hypothetical protein Q9159_005399 [Coniocarpon cinnabarinum]
MATPIRKLALSRDVEKRHTVAATAKLQGPSLTPRDAANGGIEIIADAPGAGNANGASTWNLTLDDSTAGHLQTISGGFGAAITDATVQTFNSLPADTLTTLLNDLFSADGLGFTLMRHTIGSSDLSAKEYTYDDASSPDPDLTNFGLTDNGNAMAKLIASIRSVQSSLTLLGSVWSPPGWMKLNGVIDGTTVNNNLSPAYYDAWTQYFIKYINAFNQAGANVDAITLQNEPLNSQSGYPTMYLDSTNATMLIQDHVGPALAQNNLKTKVWAYDHNTDQPNYPQAVLDGAGQYVDTVAWHCYATNNDWGVLTNFKNSNPGVTQYMTECWTSTTTSWNQAADFTMGPLQNFAAGAMAWTLGSDTNEGPHLAGGCTTCRGLVTIDTSAGTYTPQIDYYMMGQFSKYMEKGSTVLAMTGSYDYGNGKVEAVASLNGDGTRVVVVENTFPNEVYLTLTTKGGETWSGSLYKESVTTWVLPPASS